MANKLGLGRPRVGPSTHSPEHVWGEGSEMFTSPASPGVSGHFIASFPVGPSETCRPRPSCTHAHSQAPWGRG